MKLAPLAVAVSLLAPSLAAAQRDADLKENRINLALLVKL